MKNLTLRALARAATGRIAPVVLTTCILATAGTSSAQTNNNPDKLALYLPFDETNGATAFDASSLGRNGTLFQWGGAVNMRGSDTFGRYARSYHGANNQVIISNGTATMGLGANGEDFSLTFWLRLDHNYATNTERRMILQKGVGTSARTPVIGMVNNKLRFEVATTNGTTTIIQGAGGTTTLTNGVWYHVGLRKSGNQLAAFLNGTKDGEVTLSNPTVANTNPIQLGYASGLNPEHGVQASYDELAIYNRALSDAEMQPVSAAPSKLLDLPLRQSTREVSRTNGFHAWTPTNLTPPVVQWTNHGGFFRFNATHSGLEITNTNSALNNLGAGFTNNFTLSLWMRVDSNAMDGQYRQIFHKGPSNSTRGPGLWLHNNKIFTAVSRPGDSLGNLVTNGTNYSTRTLAIGEWVHVAVRKESNRITLFLDGIKDSSFDLLGPPPVINGPIVLGRHPAITSYQAAPMSVTRLTIWDRALDTTEIRKLSGPMFTMPRTIYVASDASSVETNAAAQLRTYLTNITGQTDFTLTSVKPTTNDAAFIVGPKAASQMGSAYTNGLALTNLGHDGIAIRTLTPNAPHIILSGASGSKRGTLYAVQEYLERGLGVRWYTEATNGHVVPAKSHALAPLLNVQHKPPFAWRDLLVKKINPKAWTQNPVGFPEFAVRLRLNGGRAYSPIPETWGGDHKVPNGWDGHNFYTLLNPSNHFAANPEWYTSVTVFTNTPPGYPANTNLRHALSNTLYSQLLPGDPRFGSRGQLELTNTSAMTALRTSVQASLFATNAYFMIGQEDNGNWSDNVSTFDKANGGLSGSLLRSVNGIATNLAAAYPGITFTTLAYQATVAPPDPLILPVGGSLPVPAANVLVEYAPITRLSLQPLANSVDPRSYYRLLGWDALGTRLGVWDYAANLSKYAFTLEPRFKVFGADIQLYRALGVEKLYYQMGSTGTDTDFIDMNTWLVSKLMWEPDLETEGLIDDFLEGYYGPTAAPHIKNHLREMETASLTARGHALAASNANWMRFSNMVVSHNALKLAMNAVNSNPTLSNRVLTLQLGVLQQWITKHKDYVTEAGVASSLPAEVDTIDEAVSEFTNAAVRLGFTNVGSSEDSTNIVALANELRTVGSNLSADYQLSIDPVYQAYLGGSVPPLPAAITNNNNVKQLHEEQIDITLGSFVQDTGASNHRTLSANLALTNADQVVARGLHEFGISGPHKIYASVRVNCSPTNAAGYAFYAYSWNNYSSGSWISASVPIHHTVSTSATQHVVGRPLEVGSSVTNNQYQTYYLGQQNINSGAIVVIQNIRAQSNGVTGLFVDRLIFVPVP